MPGLRSGPLVGTGAPISQWAGPGRLKAGRSRPITVGMRERLCTALLLAALGLACHSGSGGDGGNPYVPGPAAVPWTDGAWTQPVPSWGSKVRIAYPDPLTSLDLADLGAFGAHEGGHPEGLDHVWLHKTTDDLVKSWADGTVTRVDVYSDQTMITVDYGQGLIGKHMSVAQAQVAVGQAVMAGQVLGVGISGSLNNEFQLMDENRGDGVKTDVNGYSYVSPFDYLEASQQAALVAQYQAQVVTPFFTLGQEVNAGKPWEPWLTNRTLFHALHPGTLLGEWVLANRPWSTPDPLYFDLLTLQSVENDYGAFSKFCATDYATGPGSKGIVDGDFALTSQPGQVTFTYRGASSPSWYGLYSVDESGSRAVLTLAWSAQGFPAALPADAAVYEARAPVYVELDAELLGMLP